MNVINVNVINVINVNANNVNVINVINVNANNVNVVNVINVKIECDQCEFQKIRKSKKLKIENVENRKC